MNWWRGLSIYRKLAALSLVFLVVWFGVWLLSGSRWVFFVGLSIFAALLVVQLVVALRGMVTSTSAAIRLARRGKTDS